MFIVVGKIFLRLFLVSQGTRERERESRIVRSPPCLVTHLSNFLNSKRIQSWTKSQKLPVQRNTLSKECHVTIHMSIVVGKIFLRLILVSHGARKSRESYDVNSNQIQSLTKMKEEKMFYVYFLSRNLIVSATLFHGLSKQ